MNARRQHRSGTTATRRALALAAAAALSSGVACTALLPRAVPPAPPASDPLPQPARPPARPLPVVSPQAEPDPAPSDAAGVERLVTLAWVWHLASLHHPAAAVRGLPLDSAFIRAVTVVRTATDATALEQGYARFLSVLGDPLTRVEPAINGDDTSRTPSATPAAVTAERTGDSILVLRVPGAAHYTPAAEVTVREALTRAPARVVLDLRTPRGATPQADSVAAFVARTGMVEALASLPFTASTVRTRRVGGARLVQGTWQHDDAWLVRDGALVLPRDTSTRRVMLLVDSATVLPPTLLGLVSTLRATLVATGALRDDALVPSVKVDIGQGLAVRLRLGELVHADGSAGLVPDTVVADAGVADAPVTIAVTVDSTPAMRAALAFLRGTRVPRAFRFPAVRAPATLPGYYDSDPWPFMGARVLAGARLWSTMRARHAHRDLYDDDIDARFREQVPRLEAARSAREYARALEPLVSAFDDAAVTLQGPSVDTLRGVASAPFRVRWIDERAIITDVAPTAEARALALERGVEIVQVDGYPMTNWLSEQRRRVSAPNDWARTDLLMRLLPRGDEGALLLRVRDVTGRERAISVPRRADVIAQLPMVERPTQPATRTLAPGVAYLDVERLAAPAMPDAMAAVRGAGSLVLDLRGTLENEAGVGGALVAALRTRDVAVVARELHRTRATPCLAVTLRDAMVQCPDAREERARLSRGDTAGHYAGRVVALVDERTRGAMERLALALLETTDAVFIGSATAGSPAEGVPLALPGGLSLAVPAHELRRSDGSVWQRVGLNPVVDVRPTVRGARSGADEVIDRAVQWIAQQGTSPRRRR
ncbi:MAG: hypothetical protein LCH84_08455 [Gemmatimonadetes bacterium]|nr:hypothetical protein [Gemmatimonadota bacterium]